MKYEGITHGVSAAEKIDFATIQFKGEVFIASSHAAASDGLNRKFPNWRSDEDKIVLGFMTSAGRIVSYQEGINLGNQIVAKAEEVEQESTEVSFIVGK